MNFSPSQLKRYAAYSRDDFKCAYCQCDVIAGEHTSHPEAASIDHIKPKSKGGAVYDPKNWVTCCAQCNSRKGDRPMKWWLGELERDGHDVVAVKRRVRSLPRRKMRYALAKEILA